MLQNAPSHLSPTSASPKIEDDAILLEMNSPSSASTENTAHAPIPQKPLLPITALQNHTNSIAPDSNPMCASAASDKIVTADRLKMHTSPVSDAIKTFVDCLEPGDSVDVFNSRVQAWLAAKVVSVSEDDIVVHYVNWSSGYDEIICRLSYHKFAMRAPTEAVSTLQIADASESIAQHTNEFAKAMHISDAERRRTRSGVKFERRRKAPLALNIDATQVQLSSGKAEMHSVPECSLRGTYDEDLCGQCGEIEDDEGLSDLVRCNGSCYVGYHRSCISMTDQKEESVWICEQCRTGEQICYCCSKYGMINELGGVFQCRIAKCNKYYHINCVENSCQVRRNGQKRARRITTVDPTLDTSISQVNTLVEKHNFRFRCPLHTCSVCETGSHSADIMFCLRCPESYHPKCVPPSARYNTIGLLCHRHLNAQLPKIPKKFYDDQTIGIVTVDRSLKFPTLYIPHDVPKISNPSDPHHFHLPIHYLQVTKTRPAPYRTLRRSLYTFKQPKVDLSDSLMCDCTVKCDENCINRIIFSECFGPSPSSDQEKRVSNCHLGEDCGNRALHQCTYPQFELFHTLEKGFGLRVLEKVMPGQLVIEYVGEVINEQEKNHRFAQHAKLHPEDKNMYIMKLGNQEYIDARFKGSVSRFINHSCDPNCCLLKWNVRGLDRIAITALREIKDGEELTYDYKFHTSQAMQWKCYCKSHNCRGTMAPSSMSKSYQSLQRNVMLKNSLVRSKLPQKYVQRIQEKEEKAAMKRLSLTAQVCIGDRNSLQTANVRMGPAVKEMEYARRYQLFLPRNARMGANFLTRKMLKESK